MTKTLTPSERQELNAILEVLKNYKPVFKFSPELNNTLAIVYWKMLKSLGADCGDMEAAFGSLANKTPNYPSIMEVKEEIQCNPEWENPTPPVRTYDIVSPLELISCRGNSEIIIRKYVSGLLFFKCNENELKIFIDAVKFHEKDNPTLYELAYLKLYQQGINIASPIMTLTSLWELCGLKPMKRESFDIHKYVNSLSDKMAMGSTDGK